MSLQCSSDTIFEAYQIKCNASVQRLLKADDSQRRILFQTITAECHQWIQDIEASKVDLDQQKAKAMLYWHKVIIPLFILISY